MPAAKKEGKKKSVTNEVVTREYTINIHKRVHGMWVDVVLVCVVSLIAPNQFYVMMTSILLFVLFNTLVLT